MFDGRRDVNHSLTVQTQAGVRAVEQWWGATASSRHPRGGIQAVADTRGGPDERPRTVAELLPQPVHVGVQVLGLLAVAGPPGSREDHLVGTRSPGVAGQEREHFELLGRQIDGGTLQASLVV